MLLEVKGLKKYFPVRTTLFGGGGKKVVHAVDGIDFYIREGENLGLAGESGCGKTTTGKLVVRLIEPTVGSIRFMNRNMLELGKNEMRKLRRSVQIIFQDVNASLNPRKTVEHVLRRPFAIHNVARNGIKKEVLRLLEKVDLEPPEMFMNKYPHELSGGQKQRVNIARAVALNPKLVVADEAVSALDMSVRAGILNLMRRLQDELGTSYLFISHDLRVIRCVCERIAIMYLGKIVEVAMVEDFFNKPLHPYAAALLSATPIPNPKRAKSRKKAIIKGEPPSPIDLPTGCRFHPRCPYATPTCVELEPRLTEIRKHHFVACHSLGNVY